MPEGAVNTTYEFTATDVITSTKLNDILDQSVMTGAAIIGTTLEVTTSGKLKVASQGITSNELAENSVTTSSITFANSLLPSGAVMAFAMNTAPTGWLAADGSSISTGGVNAALFAAIGYTYGGSGGSFKLPDLRGYFVRGHGTNEDGSQSAGFGAKQADELKAHTHDFSIRQDTAGNGVYAESTFNANVTATITTSSTGGTETRPRNIAMLYCIKL